MKTPPPAWRKARTTHRRWMWFWIIFASAWILWAAFCRPSHAAEVHSSARFGTATSEVPHGQTVGMDVELHLAQLPNVGRHGRSSGLEQSAPVRGRLDRLEIDCPPRAGDPPSREYLCYILSRYAEYDDMYRHWDKLREQFQRENKK